MRPRRSSSASASDPLQSGDAASIERRLATWDVLVTTRATLRRAARRVPGETAATLAKKVSSSVDPTANIINVSAKDDVPRRASRIANAVVNTFLTREHGLRRARLVDARRTLTAALAELEGRRGEQAAAERADIRDQLRQLNIGAAGSRSELAVAELAEAPSKPYSPRPLRNAAFGFFAALFIATLVVLTRAQLKPRISGSRELEPAARYFRRSPRFPTSAAASPTSRGR